MMRFVGLTGLVPPCAVMAVALACVGCSDGASLAIGDLSASQLQPQQNTPTAVSGPASGLHHPLAQHRAGTAAPTSPAQVVPDRSFASRVVAAIALERVTGRKPDPSRLVASN